MHAAWITKLAIEMVRDESWEPIYFGVKVLNVKVTRHTTHAGVGLCIFTLLWMLAFSRLLRRPSDEQTAKLTSYTTRRRGPVWTTSTIRLVGNRYFSGRSDVANQLAWRCEWAARHQVNVVRLTAGRGVVPRAASSSEISGRHGELVDDAGHVDLPSPTAMNLLSLASQARAQDLRHYRWRRACCPSDWSADRSRLQDDHLHWPLIGHSATGQIWRRDFGTRLPLLTKRHAVNYYYLLSSP